MPAVAERAAQYIRAWYARPSAPVPTNAAAVSNGYGPAGGYGVRFCVFLFLCRRSIDRGMDRDEPFNHSLTWPTPNVPTQGNAAGGGQQLTITGPAPGSHAASTQYEGLLLTFARLVRAVWYKPVAYMAKGQLTLLLRPPEIQVRPPPSLLGLAVVAGMYTYIHIHT